jgi:hypothetical protein
MFKSWSGDPTAHRLCATRRCLTSSVRATCALRGSMHAGVTTLTPTQRSIRDLVLRTDATAPCLPHQGIARQKNRNSPCRSQMPLLESGLDVAVAIHLATSRGRSNGVATAAPASELLVEELSRPNRPRPSETMFSATPRFVAWSRRRGAETQMPCYWHRETSLHERHSGGKTSLRERHWGAIQTSGGRHSRLES